MKSPQSPFELPPARETPPGTRFLLHDRRVPCRLCGKEVDTVIVQAPESTAADLKPAEAVPARHWPPASRSRRASSSGLCPNSLRPAPEKALEKAP